MNEFARELEISPGSVKKFVNLLCIEHNVNMKKVGITNLVTGAQL
jgi:Mn-dependent DtxR family transcriptional regulator